MGPERAAELRGTLTSTDFSQDRMSHLRRPLRTTMEAVIADGTLSVQIPTRLTPPSIANLFPDDSTLTVEFKEGEEPGVDGPSLEIGNGNLSLAFGVWASDRRSSAYTGGGVIGKDASEAVKQAWEEWEGYEDERAVLTDMSSIVEIALYTPREIEMALGYQESAEEDRRLAEELLPASVETFTEE